jgi:hypothetical protein
MDETENLKKGRKSDHGIREFAAERNSNSAEKRSQAGLQEKKRFLRKNLSLPKQDVFENLLHHFCPQSMPHPRARLSAADRGFEQDRRSFFLSLPVE